MSSLRLKMPKVSIIIRTKNEGKWITPCLKAVFAQDFLDFEVIIVDNQSTDHTIEKAKNFNVKVIPFEDSYLPGRCLNHGIRASSGEFIVCLSGHCIPTDKIWLSNLLRNFDDEMVAAVYGRQEPLSYTSDYDKRDLLTIFGLDKKIQVKDSFFHNANSVIKREIWECFPFDENVTNIEDRIWAKRVLEGGYRIIYEPEASVYHYHGIHQNRDRERCYNVVRILENMNGSENRSDNHFKIDLLNILAIIPVKGKIYYVNSTPLIKNTIISAKESKYIKDVFVSTDNEDIAAIAEKYGAKAPFLMRSGDIFDVYGGLNHVMQYTIKELEKLRILPDVVVVLKETYPFRPKGLLDKMIEEMIKTGVDTIIPVYREYKSYFREESGGIREIDEGFMPRELKDPLYIGLAGVGLVTLPRFLMEGRQMGDKIGIYEIDEKYCRIEVRDEDDVKLAETIMQNWESKIK